MCAVVFLDIVEYSKTPVVRQLVIKNRFNEIVAKGLENVASADRRHVLPIKRKTLATHMTS